MPDYTHLTDERAVRAEALDAASLSVNMFAKHMKRSGSRYKPPKQLGGIARVVNNAWDGTTETPARADEYEVDYLDDFLLRAAKWIVTGHDTETDEEGTYEAVDEP